MPLFRKIYLSLRLIFDHKRIIPYLGFTITFEWAVDYQASNAEQFIQMQMPTIRVTQNLTQVTIYRADIQVMNTEITAGI